jgi:hypothetical protein
MTIFTLYCETDGTSLTGSFPLRSEWFENAITELLLEKGLTFKILHIELSGAICDVPIEVTYTGDWANAQILKQLKLEAAKTISILIPTNAPYTLSCHLNDKTKLRARWSQGTAAKTYLTLIVETA